MTKVAIVGNAGGGKTVLSVQISSALDLPRHSIDDVQWLPGWRPAPPASLREAHRDWLSQHRWVIDGWGTLDLIEQRFDAADTIVVIDYPLWKHYVWATKRHLLALLGLNREWPPRGCAPWGVYRRLLRLMREIHVSLRLRLIELASERRFADRVVFIRTRSELNAFLRRVAQERLLRCTGS